jgi:hypothetical protein
MTPGNPLMPEWLIINGIDVNTRKIDLGFELLISLESDHKVEAKG